MAARVAAELRKETDARVETIKGGVGEFDVFVDGSRVVHANRLWYPSPRRVVERVRAVLKG